MLSDDPLQSEFGGHLQVNEGSMPIQECEGASQGMKGCWCLRIMNIFIILISVIDEQQPQAVAEASQSDDKVSNCIRQEEWVEGFSTPTQWEFAGWLEAREGNCGEELFLDGCLELAECQKEG